MIDIDKLVLTPEEIDRIEGECDYEDTKVSCPLPVTPQRYEKAVSLATVKKVVKYIDKERGAWYNGGVIIRKEVWEVLEKSLEEG